MTQDEKGGLVTLLTAVTLGFWLFALLYVAVGKVVELLVTLVY